MRLTGKTALVTAAGQGIGKASVLAMAKEGATVWATDMNEKLLTSYAGVANIHTAALDVMDKAALALCMRARHLTRQTTNGKQLSI
jgi:2-keto-3-deoxy-L-fuconate dehydrogenase